MSAVKQDRVDESQSYSSQASLPPEWKEQKLGDCIDYMRNGINAEQNKNGNGYPVTRIETISEDVINVNKVGYVDEISEERIKRYRLRKGDILLSHINSEPQIGRSVVYREEPELLLHGMNLLVIHPNNSIDSEFLNFLFCHYRMTGVFIGLAARAVGQSSINQGRMKSLLVFIPPISEQMFIAQVLSTIQQAIEAQGKAITAAKELKKSLMRHLFTYGTVSIDQADQVTLKETEIGLMPEDWDVISLKDLNAVIGSGGTPSRKRPEFFGGSIKWIKTLDLNNGQVTSIEETITEQGINSIRGKIRPIDTVLVAMYGGAGTIGKSGILGTPAATNQAICCIEPNPQYFDSHFLHFLLISLRTSWMRDAIGTRKDPNISKGAILAKTIPFPSLYEQQDIASILSVVENKIATEQKRKSALQELFKTMLHLLMTGQLRVEDLEIGNA